MSHMQPVPNFLGVTDLEEWIVTLFQDVTQQPAKRRWYAAFGPDMYSPIVDVAVGPFAIGSHVHADDYDRILARCKRLLTRLRRAHDHNVRSFDAGDRAAPLSVLVSMNGNARCLFAVEIENRNSRKHLMGSAINASALGRIGLAVGWRPDQVRAFIRMRRYLRALGELQKNTFDTSNLLVLGVDQLAGVLLDEARLRKAQ